MFIGNYNCKIDEKGRIIIPIGMRKNISDNVMLTVVDETSFIIKDAVNWKAEEVFKYKKDYVIDYVYKNTYELQIDSQGRIKLPSNVLDNSKLDNEVIVIGHGDFIEITDLSKHLEYKENSKTI